jgi:hypothetical protein
MLPMPLRGRGMVASYLHYQGMSLTPLYSLAAEQRQCTQRLLATDSYKVHVLDFIVSITIAGFRCETYLAVVAVLE